VLSSEYEGVGEPWSCGSMGCVKSSSPPVLPQPHRQAMGVDEGHTGQLMNARMRPTVASC
jgi:hypothetical protein